MAPKACIAALNVYPVKSCRGIAASALRLAPTGFERDRHWMVVRQNGRFVTQREMGRLALIGTALTGSGLQLTAPGMPAIEIPTRTSGTSRDVVIWRDTCRGVDQGEPAAVWLTSFLGEALRLVAFDSAHERVSNAQWTGELRARMEFPDGFAVLVISEASLADLNSRLRQPLSMERFRPNMVLTGLGAYDEDRIHELRGDGVRLRFVKPCIRCSITTTNQQTGEVTDDEPLRTLKTYRWSKPLLGVMFGQNVIVVEGAGRELRVGDQLDIAWQERAIDAPAR
jgi:hypothetical protein